MQKREMATGPCGVPALLLLPTLLLLASGGVRPADGSDFLNRIEDAAKEAWSYGLKDFTRWSLRPGEATFAPGYSYTNVFSEKDARGTNISCFRIPSVTQTASGTIVAFAEARGRFPAGSCADCSPLGIAVKRSEDGGRTWGGLLWAVDPNFRDGSGKHGNAGGNPVAVFDAVTGRILLHFVRGSRDGKDCIPGKSNWQVESRDDGRTWSAPRNISSFLGPFAGALPGPGNGGVQLPSGRLVFNAHFGTAERPSGAVVVYFSDDHGATYQRMRSPAFSRMDESALATTPGGGLVISMRNDPATSGCPGGAGAADCHVRAVSRSADGGETWTALAFDKALPDSVCEAAIADVNGSTVFFNPAMRHMRNLPTLRFSRDGGRTWDRSVQIADAMADYSALVPGRLLRGGLGAGGNGVGGVLWGSCTHPLPFRVWCTPVEALHDTFWTIGFTTFDL